MEADYRASAPGDMISILKLQGRHLQDKVITSSQLQCYCCLDAEAGFCFSRGKVPLKFENKAKRLYSLLIRSFEPIFDPSYILPDKIEKFDFFPSIPCKFVQN
jgi:hypothetical protein